MPQLDQTGELIKQIKKQLKASPRDLIEIGEIQKKLRRRKLTDELAIELDRLETRYQELVDKRSAELSEHIQIILQRTRRALDEGDLPKEDFADDVRSALDELDGLRLLKDQTPTWRDALKRLVRERNDLAKVLEITRQVEALWARAEKTEQERGNPSQILELVRDALHLVDGRSSKERLVTPEPKRRLSSLRNEANKRVTDAEERHQHTPTRVSGGEIITQLKIFLKSAPDTLVTYPVSAEPTAIHDVQEVRQAIPTAKQFTLRFWREKVVEYTDAARKMLEEDHNPFGAQRVLQKCYELPGLNDPEIGLGLGGDTQILIDNLKKPIEQGVQAWQSAESLCEQALAEMDLGEAYKFLKQAIETDKFTPIITDTRSTLQTRLLKRCAEQIEKAEARVEDGSWDRASDILAQLENLLVLDQKANTSDLAKRVARTQEVLADVEELKTEVASARDPKVAKTRIDKFIERYTEERIQRWTDIRQLRDEIEAQVDAYGAITRFKARIGPTASLERLEDAADDFESERLKINEQYRNEFDALKPELDARLGYRRALDKQETDLAGALANLRPALTFRNDPELVRQAENLRNDLEKQKSSEESATKAIEEISQLIARNPRKAYENAKEWKSGKTFHTSEFVQLEKQAREKWEQNTKAMLDRHLARQSLDRNTIQQIRAGLGEFEEMHSDLETEYRAKVEVPCAVAEAEALERSTPPHGNTRWSQVVAAWEIAHQKAMIYAETDAPGYWMRRLAALKQEIRDQARTASPSRQIDLYSSLNDEFNEEDAEVWLWLGQAHFQAAEELGKRESDALFLESAKP